MKPLHHISPNYIAWTSRGLVEYRSCRLEVQVIFWLDLQGDVEDDETVPDKESDIRPRFHRSRTHSIGKSGEEVSDLHHCIVATSSAFTFYHHPIMKRTRGWCWAFFNVTSYLHNYGGLKVIVQRLNFWSVCLNWFPIFSPCTGRRWWRRWIGWRHALRLEPAYVLVVISNSIWISYEIYISVGKKQF